jgi:hypothetical protein
LHALFYPNEMGTPVWAPHPKHVEPKLRAVAGQDFQVRGTQTRHTGRRQPVRLNRKRGKTSIFHWSSSERSYCKHLILVFEISAIVSRLLSQWTECGIICTQRKSILIEGLSDLSDLALGEDS